MIEHAAKEARVAGRLADFVWADASGGEEAAEMLGLGGEKGEGGNGQRLRRLAARAVFAAADLGYLHDAIPVRTSLAIRSGSIRKNARGWTFFSTTLAGRRSCGRCRQ